MGQPYGSDWYHFRGIQPGCYRDGQGRLLKGQGTGIPDTLGEFNRSEGQGTGTLEGAGRVPDLCPDEAVHRRGGEAEAGTGEP